GRLFKRSLDRADDLFAEPPVVTARFGFESDVVGNDIGGLSSNNESDIGRAMALSFIHIAMPAVAVQIGDRQRCDRDGTDPLFRCHASVACQPLYLDLHAITPRR